MDLKKLLPKVENQMKRSRYQHTLRVRDTAIELAKAHNIDSAKAELAAIVHDYAKCRPIEELEQVIIETDLPKDLLKYHHELWHGPAGSILIQRELGITDMDVIDAVRYHTTGRIYMSDLELVIFVADYIEPGREFSGLEEVREIANKDLLKAACLTARNSIQYLLQKEATIYPDSFHAYNNLRKRLNRGV